MSYISREEALRLIADYQGGAVDKTIAKRLIMQMDEAIVLCKDCDWFNSMTHGCNRNPSVAPWEETDFCSYGERRDDGKS